MIQWLEHRHCWKGWERVGKCLLCSEFLIPCSLRMDRIGEDVRKVLQGRLYCSGQKVRLGFLHHGKVSYISPSPSGAQRAFSWHHGKAASYSGGSGEGQARQSAGTVCGLDYLCRTDATFKVPTGSIHIKLLFWIFSVLNSIIGAGNSTRQVQSLTPPWFCFSLFSTRIDTHTQTASILVSMKESWRVWDAP